MDLFHVTEKRHLDAIRKEGLQSGTYFSIDPDLVDYYAETIQDENQVPVVLRVSLSDLNEKFMVPDRPGIEEPITTALGCSEDFIHEQWRDSHQTWQDSLDIVKSVQYRAVIAPEHLLIVEEDGRTHRLDDEIAQDAIVRVSTPSQTGSPSP